MDEYIYHITKRRVAFDYIKTQGLVPASRASGTSVARREGAFASESEKNIENKARSKLTVPIARAIKYGYTNTQIENKNYMFTSIPLDEKLMRNEAFEYLDQFARSLYDQHFPKLAGKASSMTSSQLKKSTHDLANDLFNRNPQHALSRFAKEMVRLEYALEERETSNHIYFFLLKKASICYPAYTGHHGGALNCRVLRVKRNVVNHLEQDMAEGNGLMTLESVTPQSIEIYNAEGNPFDSAASDLWVPLTQAAES